MPPAEEPVDASTDLQLLRRTAAGDHGAFAAFVERHQAAIFCYASTLLPGREDAEDVLQDTFLAAYRSAGQFRGDASGRTWLFCIARRSAWRKASAARTVGGDTEELEALALAAGWGSPDPERLAILAEDRRLLEGAFRQLPPQEREILWMREFEQMPGEAAAAVLGLTLPAMKSRLHRARLHLAALLRQQTGGGE
ncbi:MAG: RNA polymerase sigma factor [Acidobacteriota bacterium]|nr:RNA polymerase sigma factor [Acidobacteriota bacterium]